MTMRSHAEWLLGEEPRGNASNSVIIWELPKFVTYFAEETREWVRVPTFLASVDQLRFMSRYRNEQAMQLRAKADELAATLAQIEGVIAENPGMNLPLVRDVWIQMGGPYYPGMLPDVKPSPPKPKVGDPVVSIALFSPRSTATVVAIGNSKALVRFDDGSETAWHLDQIEVIQRLPRMA